MALSTQPYKGTRDFYPEDMRLRRWMFEKMRAVVESYGYQEYDGPMLEPFELYAAKTGEEIVNKQLYWLVDQGERKLAIRPEMTPTLARMIAARVQELPKPIRWYSLPNLWRYERPQRGRLREHWQLNVDVLGGERSLADFEIVVLALQLMRAFGGEKQVVVRVNHRQLVDEFFKKNLGLKADLAVQTVKALDAREKVGEEGFQKWLKELGLSAKQVGELEKFSEWSLPEAQKNCPGVGADELKKFFELVKASGFEKQVAFDPKILRGMDYYTGTVFEMYDTSPENRRAMFGGGRYDNLIGLFGKSQLSGVGLGFGDVTLANFLETHKLVPPLISELDVYVTLPDEGVETLGTQLADRLRAQGWKTALSLEVGRLGDQLRNASKLGARVTLILGEDEVAEGKIAIKDMKEGKQTTHKQTELESAVRAILSRR